MRGAALAATAAAVGVLTSAQTIPWTCAFNSPLNKSANSICPAYGQPCGVGAGVKHLGCARGAYCRATAVSAAGGAGYTGVCDTAPSLAEVYGKPCTLGADVPDCVFANPLAGGPAAPPSALRCMRALPTDVVGTCRLGPAKAGDACNLASECASGVCTASLGLCAGVGEGEPCTPGFPDPCAAQHYCAAAGGAGGAGAGVCAKAVSPGRPCASSASCTAGYYCAASAAGGGDAVQLRCVPPFSAPVGANTTLGPWMCASGAALVAAPGAAAGGGALAADAIYTCTAGGNATASTGRPCNSALAYPGYDCACARTPASPTGGQFQLRARGDTGLSSGAAAAAWLALHTCLVRAQGVMGGACLFDSPDMSAVRYGSCAYYACTSQYAAVIAATAQPAYAQPLVRWADVAACEVDAAAVFFAAVPAAPCVVLPRLEEWRCTVPPTPPVVAGTSGLVAVIIIGTISGYILHVYLTRKDHPGSWPFGN